jgi:hypothetical protein
VAAGTLVYSAGAVNEVPAGKHRVKVVPVATLGTDTVPPPQSGSESKLNAGAEVPPPAVNSIEKQALVGLYVAVQATLPVREASSSQTACT